MIYFVFIALGILLVAVISQIMIDLNKLSELKKGLLDKKDETNSRTNQA